MHISAGDKQIKLSNGVLFVIHRHDGLSAYLSHSKNPDMVLLWDSPNVVQKLVELMKVHPALYEFLPIRFKSQSTIKSTALMASLEDPKD